MTLVNIPSGMLVECGVDECCTITRTFKPIEKFTGIFKCHECRGMAGYDTCVSCGALCKWKQDEFEDVVGHTCHMCVKELYKNHPEKDFAIIYSRYGGFTNNDFDEKYNFPDDPYNMINENLQGRFGKNAITAYFKNYYKRSSGNWWYRLQSFDKRDLKHAFDCDAVTYSEYDGMEIISINEKMLTLYRKTINLQRQNKKLESQVEKLKGQVKKLKNIKNINN